MTQSVGSQVANKAGIIQKVGTSQDGRIVYQMINPDGESQGHLSVAPKDADKFEKSYNTIVETAPGVQKFSEKYSTPESLKKLRNKIRMWGFSLGAVAGLTTNYFTGKIKSGFLQFLAVAGATIAGYLLGNLIGAKTTMPSDVTRFTNATQDITKMDIKPYIEGDI